MPGTFTRVQVRLHFERRGGYGDSVFDARFPAAVIGADGVERQGISP